MPSFDITAEDLFPAEKAKSEQVYCNPENPSQTWSGCGRKPAWFIKQIEAGFSAEDMRIHEGQ